MGHAVQFQIEPFEFDYEMEEEWETGSPDRSSRDYIQQEHFADSGGGIGESRDMDFGEAFDEGSSWPASASADAVEQFIGTEHRDIADLAAGRESTTIAYGEHGERLTFGEMVALAGDYFETYYEIVELARTAAGREKIAWARWDALDLRDQKAPEPKADKKSVINRFYVLASRNWSHFSAGGEARQTYFLWHSRAMVDALDAGLQANDHVWRRAMTKEAFALHFLTDMFSAGHVRVPRIAIRDWYAKHMPGDHLLRYMTRFLYDKLHLPWYAHVFKGSAQDRIRQGIVELGGAAVTTVSVGDIVGKALHDRDGQGLRVVSDVNADGQKIQGGYSWFAVGDGKLGQSSAGAETKKMAMAAVITSLRDLELVRGMGRKLAGRTLSTAQKADTIRQALAGRTFTALSFVPRENHTAGANGANVPLPGPTGGKSPLEWRWGQLGDITYKVVDDTVKTDIAGRLFDRLTEVADLDRRNALRLFAEHLCSEGIGVLEKAVGKKAR
jgi:hypothetical protein